MAYDGIPWQEAIRLKEEAESDERFLVYGLASHWSGEEGARMWYLHIRFEYPNPGRKHGRISATIHNRERWEAFKQNCLAQARAVQEQRRPVGRPRRDCELGQK